MSRPWNTWLIAGIAILSFNAHLLIQAYGQPGSEEAEKSPLAVEPDSPIGQLEATILMSELGRYDLAKQYLQQLLKQNFSDEELLSLRDHFGTVELFRLSQTKQLQPDSQTLMDKITDASRKNAADPARVDRVLADLDKSPREREMAILELKNIGIAAMPRLIQHLGNPKSDQDKDRLVYIMTKMGPRVLPALFGAMESGEPILQSSVLEVIGFLAKSDMTDPLWYHAVSKEELPAVQISARIALSRILFGNAQKTKYITSFGAQDRMAKAAKQYLGNQKPWTLDDAGRVTLWKWDAKQKTVRSISVTPAAANLDAATKYSQQALGISGEKKEFQALFLSSILSDAAYRAGWKETMSSGPGTAFNLALTSGIPALTRSIEISLEAGQVRAAEAAMAALAMIGNDNLLKSTEKETSIFIRGLNYPNRRIQFAAAAGILQLEPEQSFRSANRVVQIMAQALNDDGSDKVLVIDPNTDRGRTIAAAVSQMGYNQKTVSTGKTGFKQAAARGDVSLILIHLNCVDWELSQTISNLRADARTADLPIVVYGPTFMKTDLLLTIQRTPKSLYLVYSDKREDVERQLKPFLGSQTSPALTPQQRAQRSKAAAYWLAQIAESDKGKIFPLESATESLFAAINSPEIASDALNVLTKIKTNRAQLFLAEAVLAQNQTSEIRQQAAMSLAFHIQKSGLLIDKEILASLKILWKSTPDAAIQTALTSVVGSLKPSPAMTKARMQSFVLPTLPASN